MAHFSQELINEMNENYLGSNPGSNYGASNASEIRENVVDTASETTITSSAPSTITTVSSGFYRPLEPAQMPRLSPSPAPVALPRMLPSPAVIDAPLVIRDSRAQKGVPIVIPAPLSLEQRKVAFIRDNSTMSSQQRWKYNVMCKKFIMFGMEQVPAGLGKLLAVFTGAGMGVGLNQPLLERPVAADVDVASFVLVYWNDTIRRHLAAEPQVRQLVTWLSASAKYMGVSENIMDLSMF